jgi:LemA protein
VEYVVIGIVVVLIVAFISIYNALVRGRNQVKNAWAQIDVQLKRRYDLIPNLVETAKGYMQGGGGIELGAQQAAHGG